MSKLVRLLGPEVVIPVLGAIGICIVFGFVIKELRDEGRQVSDCQLACEIFRSKIIDSECMCATRGGLGKTGDRK